MPRGCMVLCFARESSAAHGAVLPDFAAASGLSAVRGCIARPDAASVALYAPDAVLADFVAAWWARLPLSACASSSVASSASVVFLCQRRMPGPLVRAIQFQMPIVRSSSYRVIFIFIFSHQRGSCRHSSCADRAIYPLGAVHLGCTRAKMVDSSHHRQC